MTSGDLRAVKLVMALCAASVASSGGLHVYHTQSKDLIAYRLDQIDKRLDRWEERLSVLAVR